MKKIFYIISLFLTMGVIGCIDDETTGPHREISEITISFKDTIFYVNKNAVLTIDPTEFIAQTNDERELSYTWRGGFITQTKPTGEIVVDSLKYLSGEKVFKHAFDEFGQYHCRLTVTNEHGSAYQYFRVVVTSAFDEGLVMLSKNENGEAMFSVLNTKTNEEELLEKTREDFWYRTVETEPLLADNINDFAMYVNPGSEGWPPRKSNWLYVLSGKTNRIYTLDPLSLVVMDNTTYRFLKEPKLLMLPWHMDGPDMTTYMADGDVCTMCFMYGYEIPRLYAFPEEHHWDDAKVIKMYKGSWDDEQRDVLMLFDDARNTVCGITTHDCESTSSYKFNPIAFDEGQKVINFAYQRTMYGGHMFGFILLDETRRKVTVQWYRGVWWNTDFSGRDYYSRYEYDLPAGRDFELTRESFMVPCARTSVILYNTKYRVYRWNAYEGGDVILPSLETGCAPSLYVDVREINPNAEVACFTQDVTNKYLYVAVYDIQTRRGSIYVYSTFDFTLLKKFEDVGDQPVKLFYKPNVQR